MTAAILALMRPAHWTKNVFVFAPVVFAQRLTDPESLWRATVAFLCFCAASSSVYIFNDIRDREEDRRHPLKRKRPLAAGTISVPAAAAASGALALAAVGGSVPLGGRTVLVVLVYLALNLLYSAGLKHVVILDVMIVSLGFVLRVIGGGEAVNVEISAWLLLCTIFLSLFLVFSKRRHELMLLDDAASGQRPVLSHYSRTFLDQMINVVTASSVVSYALYCVAPETVEKIHSRALVYTVPFVLFGIFRYLYLIYQRPSDLTPTEALVRDVPFLVNILGWGALVLWIGYGG